MLAEEEKEKCIYLFIFAGTFLEIHVFSLKKLQFASILYLFICTTGSLKMLARLKPCIQALGH